MRNPSKVSLMFRHNPLQSVALLVVSAFAGLVLLGGCSPKSDAPAGGAANVAASNSEVAPAIARCVAMQSGNIQIKSKFSENPTPAMRAQMEVGAEAAANKAREEHLQLLKQTCEKTVLDACKTSMVHCKKMYGG